MAVSAQTTGVTGAMPGVAATAASPVVNAGGPRVWRDIVSAAG